MRGIVKEVNDTSDKNWAFIFKDENGTEYYVMGLAFYNRNNIKDPVNKGAIDSLNVGMAVDFDFKKIEGINVVTSFKWGEILINKLRR